MSDIIHQSLKKFKFKIIKTSVITRFWVKIVMKKVYKSLISRQAGIYWQIYFGFLVIVGSVVPQGAPDVIKNGKLPEFLKTFLLLIEANNLYRSPLFILSLVVFFVALSLSTYEIVFPLFRTTFKKTVTPSKVAILRMPMLLEISGFNIEQSKNLITKKRYNVINEDKSLVHFEKNKWAKTSAMVSHISLFLILIGISLSILTSFKGTAALVPSEQISLKRIVDKADTKGKFVNVDNENWSIKVNSFKMDFHPNGMVKQYYSDLSVIDDISNKELTRKTIFVNEPLVYNNVYFYQASWGISHLSVLIDNVPTNIDLQPLKNEQGSVSDKKKIGNNEYIFFLNKNNEVYVFDLQAQPVAQLIKNQISAVENTNIELKDIVLFTGLQVKKDLGIPLVYVGFVVLILALCINFFSYAQVWILEHEGKYYIAGKASRGANLMEQELNKIADLIEIELPNTSKKKASKVG